ncbi:hypothetical protein ACFRU3_46455 [Streptomyces sp. NPDC056910]|uniref:hypothetical protein n=1 Tax=Streptomyces sp. NPDC056910 TaxID=3345964 RepID=UPI0036B7B497
MPVHVICASAARFPHVEPSQVWTSAFGMPWPWPKWVARTTSKTARRLGKVGVMVPGQVTPVLGPAQLV